MNTRPQDIFRQTALDITVQPLSSPFSAAGPALDDEALDNVIAKKADEPDDSSVFKTAFNNAREMAAAGSVDGVYTKALAKHNKDVRERERRRQGKDDMADLLALLDAQIADLERQIAEYDRLIEEYEEQLSAIDELRELIESGELDPTDPEHIALLRRAGIPEDDWGTVTIDDLDGLEKETKDKLDDAKQKRDDARDQLDKTQKVRDGVANALVKDPDAKSIDIRSFGLDEESAAKKAEDPTYDPANATADDMRDLLDRSMKNFISQRTATHENESAWFKLSEKELRELVSEEGYVDGLDQLINELEENTKKVLLEDPDISEAVKDRIRIDEFERAYEDFQEFRDEAQYHDWLESLLLNDTDERTRKILVNSDDTPEEVREILLSAEVEEMTSSPVFPSKG